MLEFNALRRPMTSGFGAYGVTMGEQVATVQNLWNLLVFPNRIGPSPYMNSMGQGVVNNCPSWKFMIVFPSPVTPDDIAAIKLAVATYVEPLGVSLKLEQNSALAVILTFLFPCPAPDQPTLTGPAMPPGCAAGYHLDPDLVCRPDLGVYTPPVACTQDVKWCPGGSYVGRNPSLNCDWNPCPQIQPPTPGPSPCQIDCAPGYVMDPSNCTCEPASTSDGGAGASSGSSAGASAGAIKKKSLWPWLIGAGLLVGGIVLAHHSQPRKRGEHHA